MTKYEIKNNKNAKKNRIKGSKIKTNKQKKKST